MLIETAKDDPTDELDEVTTFITEFHDDTDEEEDSSELDAWV